MKRLDVTALIFGLLLSVLAVTALWQSITGRLDWSAIKIAAPLALVVVGVIGLSLSRRE